MTFAIAAVPSQDASGAAIRAPEDARMRLRLGCEFTYHFPQPTPLIAMVNVHYSRFADLERPDHLITSPGVPIESYRDMFGNWCARMVAPAGDFVLGTDAIIRDPGLPDQFDLTAPQHKVEDLPADTLTYLLQSRYCEVDLLLDDAGRLFGHLPHDASRCAGDLRFRPQPSDLRLQDRAADADGASRL
jgi:transglutaminase-like putative cysteine protease